MAIQRYLLYYTNDFQNDYPAFSRAQVDGDWVHFEDVVPLEAEVAELRAKLDALQAQEERDYRQLLKHSETIDALQAQLAALREAAEPFLVGQPWLDYRQKLGDEEYSEGESQTIGEYRALARAMEATK